MRLPDRIIEKIDASGDCWEWTGAQCYGYGRVGYGKKTWLAHRLIWELLVGPIPKGMTIDHLCRNHACVNPDHMEIVDRQENTLRGYGLSGQNGRKTHCPRGHPYSGENLRLYQAPNKNHPCRRCRICGRDDYHKWYAAKKAREGRL